MSLYAAFYKPCQRMVRNQTPDEYGGFHTTWEPGEAFQAAVIKDSSVLSRIAQKEGVAESYTVTIPVGVLLDHDDVFRRLADGATFRVTSNVADSIVPEMAGFAFGQVTAERWVIPE